MTTYLLAGGGTAGHVNPLLAVADALRARDPEAVVLVLGTRGLEARLVPERGVRAGCSSTRCRSRAALDKAAAALPRRGSAARDRTGARPHRPARHVDVVVGFGGATPPAPRLRGGPAVSAVPFIVHEANARPGLANVLGACRAAGVGVARRHRSLKRSRVVGMPLRREIVTLDRDALSSEAAAHFGLDPESRCSSVFGGSLGAQRLNAAFGDGMAPRGADVLDAGWQLLRITGKRSGARRSRASPGTRCAATSTAWTSRSHSRTSSSSRPGAATVSEISALGIPTVYAACTPSATASRPSTPRPPSAPAAAVLIADADFTGDRVRSRSSHSLADDARRTRDGGGCGIRRHAHRNRERRRDDRRGAAGAQDAGDASPPRSAAVTIASASSASRRRSRTCAANAAAAR